MTRYASFTELRAAIAGGDVRLSDMQDAPDATPQPDLAQPSHLEALFLRIWQALDGEPLEREHRFDTERRWRFDFALQARRIAIEIEGGLHNGRHTKAAGYAADCEKYNAATMAGWRVIRLTPVHLSPPYIEILIAWTKQENGE